MAWLLRYGSQKIHGWCVWKFINSQLTRTGHRVCHQIPKFRSKLWPNGLLLKENAYYRSEYRCKCRKWLFVNAIYTYSSVIYEGKWSRMSRTVCASSGMMSATWRGNIDGTLEIWFWNQSWYTWSTVAVHCLNGFSDLVQQTWIKRVYNYNSDIQFFTFGSHELTGRLGGSTSNFGKMNQTVKYYLWCWC